MRNGRRIAGAVSAVVLLAGLASGVEAVTPPPGQISTYAGTIGEGPGTGIAQRPAGLAARGTKVYVGSSSLQVIRELDTLTGDQRVIAGNGRNDLKDPAALGASGSARAASLGYIDGLDVDAGGNLYAVDSVTFRVRKITPEGTISIVAGNGVEGYSGDGGPAREASLRYMRDVAVDGAGNVYIADADNHRVRKVDATGTITTVAGNGTDNETSGIGDGRLATAAPVHPLSVAVDRTGRVYIGDRVGGGRLRTIQPDGTIVTVAGGGSGFPSPSGVSAASVRLFPLDLAFAPDGRLYMADVYFVGRLDLATGTVTRVAGTGRPQFSDFNTGGRSVDGRLAVETNMNAPQRIAVTASGDLYVGDGFENRVWRVDTSGVLTTMAGTGWFQLAGDGGPAAAAMFWEPQDLLVDGSGGVIVADQYNQRVRRIDASGVITTIAGSGGSYGGFGGDGGPAIAAQLSYPSGVARDAAGNLYIADQGNHRIRRVDPGGTITTFAEVPHVPGMHTLLGGIAVDLAGNVYVSQVYPRRVLKFDPIGIPRTLLGSDEYDSPTSPVRYPQGLTLGPDGMLYVADTYGGQVLRMDPASGSSTPVAPWAWGLPRDVAFDGAGNLYVADGPRVRRVDPAGRLTTVAGTGVAGSSGDGDPATNAKLVASAVAVAGSDLLLIDRYAAPLIRRVSGINRLPAADALRTFGWNGYAMLGDGTAIDRPNPVAAAGVRDAISLAAGYVHTLAVRRDGTVWAAGWNRAGTLGTGGTADSSTFVQVPGLTGVTAVAAGAYHSLALKADGTVWAWGWNVAGQVGDGTTVNRMAPVRVPGLTGVVAISAGAVHSVALKSDGTVWTWGWNVVGQLGVGSTVDQHRPVKVPGLSGVRAIAAGSYHTLAVAGGRTVAVWGWNAKAQLGDGTTTDRLAPVPVDVPVANGELKAIAGGLLHSVALGSAGDTWTWGWNGVGQLGDGTTNDRLRPGQVAELHGVRMIVAGTHHTLAVKGDQTVLGWGWNAFGQLGDGTTVDRWRPTAVPGVEGVVAVAGGLAHSALG